MEDTIIGTVADWEKIYRKTLSPYISHTYIAEGVSTPVTLVANVPKKYPLPVTLKESNGFGVYDAGGEDQSLQLQAVGADNVLFKLDASSSLVTTAVNCNVWMYLYKRTSIGGESLPVAGSIIKRKIGTSADLGALSLDSTFRASEGDLLEVYVQTDVNTDLTFSLTSIVITEV